MAARIEIRTDSGSLDLPNDFHKVFYTTKQIHDLRNLETRNADFTQTVIVPATPNNIAILGAQADINGSLGLSEIIINCSILMDGIPFAEHARMIHGKTIIDRDFTGLELTIMYGNFRLFDSLSGKGLEDLNWADAAELWTIFNVQQMNLRSYTTSNPEKMVWGIADWHTRDSENFGFYGIDMVDTIDISNTGFFLYARNIIERILAEAGYTVKLDRVPDDYSKIALACPVAKFMDIHSNPDSKTSGDANSNLAQVVHGGSARTEFQSTTNSSDATYDLGTNQWNTSVSANITLEVAGVYDYRRHNAGATPSRFLLYRNGLEIDSIEITQNANNVPFFMSVQTAANVGDIFYLEMESAIGSHARLTLEAGTAFYYVPDGVSPSRVVQPSEHIPQIPQGEFIANILKLFNLIITTDDFNREVTIAPFDNIYVNKEFELSNRLAGGENGIVIDKTTSALGQYSNFSWESDNLLRSDAKFTKRYDNQVLEKSKDVISMDFSACDESVMYYNAAIDFQRKAKIPMAKTQFVEWDGFWKITIQADGTFALSPDNKPSFNVGDFFSTTELLDNHTYRILTKTSDTTGTVQIPIFTTTETALTGIFKLTGTTFEDRLVIIEDDTPGSQPIYQISDGNSDDKFGLQVGGLTAMWPDRLTWRRIVETYYLNLLAAFENTQIITAKFHMATLEIAEFDFTNPVYVSNFNDRYYVNKIEQFKLDSLVRLELFRIGTGLAIPEPPEPPLKKNVNILNPTDPASTFINVDGGSSKAPPGSLPFDINSTIEGLGLFSEPPIVKTYHIQFRNNPSNTIIDEMDLVQNVQATLQLIPGTNPLWEGGEIDFQLITRPI